MEPAIVENTNQPGEFNFAPISSSQEPLSNLKTQEVTRVTFNQIKQNLIEIKAETEELKSLQTVLGLLNQTLSTQQMNCESKTQRNEDQKFELTCNEFLILTCQKCANLIEAQIEELNKIPEEANKNSTGMTNLNERLTTYQQNLLNYEKNKISLENEVEELSTEIVQNVKQMEVLKSKILDRTKEINDKVILLINELKEQMIQFNQHSDKKHLSPQVISNILTPLNESLTLISPLLNRNSENAICRDYEILKNEIPQTAPISIIHTNQLSDESVGKIIGDTHQQGVNLLNTSSAPASSYFSLNIFSGLTSYFWSNQVPTEEPVVPIPTTVALKEQPAIKLIGHFAQAMIENEFYKSDDIIRRPANVSKMKQMEAELSKMCQDGKIPTVEEIKKVMNDSGADEYVLGRLMKKLVSNLIPLQNAPQSYDLGLVKNALSLEAKAIHEILLRYPDELAILKNLFDLIMVHGEATGGFTERRGLVAAIPHLEFVIYPPKESNIQEESIPQEELKVEESLLPSA